MASLALTPTSGSLVCIDIQPEACENTRTALAQSSHAIMDRVHIICDNHKTFPEFILPKSVSLVVYNLGSRCRPCLGLHYLLLTTFFSLRSSHYLPLTTFLSLPSSHYLLLTTFLSLLCQRGLTGYLPGGKKEITTKIEDTVASISAALLLLKPKGLLSVLCYR